MEFDEKLIQWQPFFTTVAAVSATLVGLLFVSLSLNRERISAESNRELMRLARRSFSDFLLVLMLALFFLIPRQGQLALSLELLAISAFRLRWMSLQIIHAMKHEHKPGNMAAVREYVLPVLSVIGIIGAAIGIYFYGIIAVYYFVVPVIAVMLTRASWNAWLLLVLERD
jgi:hypothetical protein